MREPEKTQSQGHGSVTLHLPAPTIWPLVLGLGITLCLAGLITNFSITLLGLLLAAMAAVGWFRNVLPQEKHEAVQAAVEAGEHAVASALAPAAPHATAHAKGVTLSTYSFISGIEAGVAGGAAMAIPAVLYSLVKFHSLWYAINLMAASSFLSWSDASDVFLSQFHLQGLIAGLAIHAMVSVLIGMLYAAMLPIFPRLSLLTGGVVAPLLWSGIAYALMASVTPVLGSRVDWPWFILSQIAFGLVAGMVVNLRVRVRTAEFQALPFAQRAGLHSNQQHDSDNHEVKP